MRTADRPPGSCTTLFSIRFVCFRQTFSSLPEILLFACGPVRFRIVPAQAPATRSRGLVRWQPGTRPCARTSRCAASRLRPGLIPVVPVPGATSCACTFVQALASSYPVLASCVSCTRIQALTPLMRLSPCPGAHVLLSCPRVQTLRPRVPVTSRPRVLARASARPCLP